MGIPVSVITVPKGELMEMLPKCRLKLLPMRKSNTPMVYSVVAVGRGRLWLSDERTTYPTGGWLEPRWVPVGVCSRSIAYVGGEGE